jgi:hypothetical protein
MMLFMSDRTGRREVHGYSADTGEILQLNQKNDGAAVTPLASRQGDRIYIVRDNTILLWSLNFTSGPPTEVSITESKICDFPHGAVQFAGLNENCNADLLSFGYILNNRHHIAVADIQSGETAVVAQLGYPVQHIQFSWDRPDLLSFARSYGSDTAPLDSEEPAHARIWFVNVLTKTPVPAFYQQPGELVTHECWWRNDQITFVGGHRKEEGHVKVLDIRSGEIRILGAGSWWQTGTNSELAMVNWWHAAGSPDGRWIAADNWHGIIALFNAKTTEMKILTQGHRTYGGGAHPHVGWDLSGGSVEFTSNKYGNPDVCIGIIPGDW